jgi:hypothetical protein
MATRVIKLREAEQPAPEMGQEVLSQSKRPEVGRFLLQVDRQTKQSYATAEAAEMAGMVIKKGHPIVRVSVYDSVETANKIIELPAGSSVARAIPLFRGFVGCRGERRYHPRRIKDWPPHITSRIRCRFPSLARWES